eukprot:56158_1
MSSKTQEIAANLKSKRKQRNIMNKNEFESKISDKEQAKKCAAHLAVQENVCSNQIIGIGGGSTVAYAINKIAELYASKQLINIICVPTSYQSQQLIIANKLPLGNLKQHWQIDISIDGADEVDANLNCIKGGAASHLQEKMVAFNAKKFVIIADYSKQSNKLCTKYKRGVPLSFQINALYYLEYYVIKTLKDKIKNLSDRNVKCNLRMGKNKAGPVVTDEGHMLYDIDFDGVLECNDIEPINNILQCLPGVVETGLFVNMVQTAYFGQIDGSVVKQSKDSMVIIKGIGLN